MQSDVGGAEELKPMPKRKFAARALTNRTYALLDERRRAIESGADSIKR